MVNTRTGYIQCSPVKCQSRMLIGRGTRGDQINILLSATFVADRPRKRFLPHHEPASKS